MANVKFGHFKINLQELYEKQAHLLSHKVQDATNHLQDVFVKRTFNIEVLNKFQNVMESPEEPASKFHYHVLL